MSWFFMLSQRKACWDWKVPKDYHCNPKTWSNKTTIHTKMCFSWHVWVIKPSVLNLCCNGSNKDKGLWKLHSQSLYLPTKTTIHYHLYQSQSPVTWNMFLHCGNKKANVQPEFLTLDLLVVRPFTDPPYWINSHSQIVISLYSSTH